MPKPLALVAALAVLGAAGTVRAGGERPATSAGERVMALLTDVREGMRETRYQHRARVRVHRGEYFFDCSGMVQWVLSRTARRSMLDLDEGERPLAIHFVWRIQRAPTDRFRSGWRRIERMGDVRPGDAFAWERPENFRSRNTGHVGFVIAPPRRIGDTRVYAVRVADASRYTHQDDTRPWPGPGEATTVSPRTRATIDAPVIVRARVSPRVRPAPRSSTVASSASPA